MRFFDIAVVLATAGVVLAAIPHRHAHRHAHKRSPVLDVVTVPGPTVYAFEFNGEAMTQDEVCKGIHDGTLQWAPGTYDPPNCASLTAPKSLSSSTPVPTTTPTPSPTPSVVPNELYKVASSSTSSSTPAASPSAAPSQSPSKVPASSSGSGATNIDNNPNTNTPFPDGQLDCSHFPSDYGAIPISWMGLGGWSGIQLVQMDGNSVSHIVTATAGQGCANTPDGTAMCSYACPPGYQKSQWPTQQGSTGQSVGGLKCGSDNKLHLTNPGLSKHLCIQGTGAAEVQNTLGTNVAICRTDYPGTESETVPLNTQPGATHPLTCPDERTYYQWLNNPTSAQYYINPKGVPVDEACQWSTNGTSVGNFAPSYLGAGTDASGNSWLAITSTQQQNPANYQNLDYTIELKGNFGGDNACFHVVKGGVAYYCSKGTPGSFDPKDCQTFKRCEGGAVPPKDCNEAPGCTVMVKPGAKGTYVLS